MSVETFVWDELFETGILSVDEQHHQLVELVNELSVSFISAEKHNDDAVSLIVSKLADYAVYHFADEERLMQELRIDQRHVQRHIASHRKFVEQVSTMWGARNAMSDPASIVLQFLVAWLSFHILGEDQSFARQARRIHQGASPADAYEAEIDPDDRATTALLRALWNLYHIMAEQNNDLAKANLLLETRVVERTHELEVANQRLEQMSRTDGLLGIANRMYFDGRLQSEWKTAQFNSQPLSLVMMDVDYFKKYIDTYGHLGGDACLRTVAKAASEGLCRPTDVLARYGGEELVALLPGTNTEGAFNVAKRIMSCLQKKAIPHASSEVSKYVTLSIGIATLTPNCDKTPSDLVFAADEALYQAKLQGRNRICLQKNPKSYVGNYQEHLSLPE